MTSMKVTQQHLEATHHTAQKPRTTLSLGGAVEGARLLAAPGNPKISCNSPRPSIRVSILKKQGWQKLRKAIVDIESRFESRLIAALKVPRERPIDVLGPSREFHEKHGLTLINNLMGLSCLFFLTIPLTIATQYQTIMEHGLVAQLLALCMFIVYLWQTVLSISGDFWFTRLSPETGNTSRALRWIQGKRQKIVVTSERHVATWKRWWIFTSLDVITAHLNVFIMTGLIAWQVWHGMPCLAIGMSYVIAIACQKIGSSQWRGSCDNTYCPKKIWWFNFFHFNWHFVGNIGLYLVAADFCKNGLRGF